MAALKLNVSIVTYRTHDEDLRRCINSLLGSRLVSRIDVLDNSSTESTRRLCRTYCDRVEYRPNPNVGFGRAHNISLQRSLDEGADYHLVINADVYFGNGTIESCIDYMQSHPECGQLIPRVNFPDGSFQSVCHPLPNPMELMLHRLTPWGWNMRRIVRYELRDRDMTVPRNVPVHHGCFMLFRCSALREVGLFDERYFMYAEDFDLTRRMHERYTTIFYPQASVTHIFCGGSRREPRLFWIHCKSMLKYFWKWGFIFDKGRRDFNRRLYAETPLQKDTSW